MVFSGGVADCGWGARFGVGAEDHSRFRGRCEGAVSDDSQGSSVRDLLWGADGCVGQFVRLGDFLLG